MAVKNLIFDLGNVIIDLDINRTWQHLEHWLGDDYQNTLKAINPESDIFIDFEIGKITEQHFLQTLRNATETPLSFLTLKDAWNAMLLSINPARFDMLARLKEKYRVFILSNINETHHAWVDGYLQTVHGFDISALDTRFSHRAYYSHLMGLRKPNANIYEFVLEKEGLIATETLFIDDNADNIKGAQSVGLQTILHKIGDEIVDVMRDF